MVTAYDVLTEKVRCGPWVVVLGVSMIGCEVADWLGMRRKDVTLVKMRPGTEIGGDVSLFSRPWLMDRLEDWKVKVIAGPREGAKVKEITDAGAVIIRDGQGEAIAADSVVAPNWRGGYFMSGVQLVPAQRRGNEFVRAVCRLSLRFAPAFDHYCLDDYWQAERRLNRVDCIQCPFSQA